MLDSTEDALTVRCANCSTENTMSPDEQHADQRRKLRTLCTQLGIELGNMASHIGLSNGEAPLEPIRCRELANILRDTEMLLRAMAVEQ